MEIKVEGGRCLMYQVNTLTKYISEIKYAKEDTGVNKPENSVMVEAFIRDVYHFIDNNNELELTQYQHILSGSGIEWGVQKIEDIDVSVLDGKCVLAIIVGIIRADRFCDGIIVEYFKNVYLLKCLERLAEIDKALN